MLEWIKRRLRGVRQRPDLFLVMYSRVGCHLCDVAWDQLRQARDRHGFQMEKRDVDADPELVAQFGACVPVVLVNGKVRFRGRVNPVLLQRLLDGPDSMEFASEARLPE